MTNGQENSKIVLTVNRNTIRKRNNFNMDSEGSCTQIIRDGISSIYHFRFNKEIIVCRVCRKPFILKLNMIAHTKSYGYLIKCPLCGRINEHLIVSIEDTKKSVMEYLNVQTTN